MARIRTIKPEFWSSTQVMECSRDARLLFIGMWNFADDDGRMRYAPKSVRAQVFPGDLDLSVEDVTRCLEELASNKLIAIYDANGEQYIQITGWRHQHISHPRQSNLPSPSLKPREASGKAREASVNAREHSGNGAKLQGALAPDLHYSSPLRSALPKKGRPENFEIERSETIEGLKVPRHGARSRDKRFVYFRAGTFEFEEYSRDFEEATGEEPEATAYGRWFKFHGEVVDRLRNQPRKGSP